jgi:hypothetical protein
MNIATTRFRKGYISSFSISLIPESERLRQFLKLVTARRQFVPALAIGETSGPTSPFEDDLFQHVGASA